jgi:flagellar hook assembly protein FlgD
LSESGNITIDVFNLKGEFVTCLVNEYKQNGNYSLVWNGRDYNGKEIPSGTYIIKLNNNGKTTVTKCVLLK